MALGGKWWSCSESPSVVPTLSPAQLTAATRLLSVMKVTARRGRVSVHREATLKGRDKA